MGLFVISESFLFRFTLMFSSLALPDALPVPTEASEVGTPTALARRSFFCSYLFLFRCGNGFCPARLEFLHAAGDIQEFFFAGVERMAVRADLNIKLRLCGADGKRISARAFYFRGGVIFGMNFGFHWFE